MHILHVVGARPNFMKVAPVYRTLAARAAKQSLIHTGQHFDANMSAVFFSELGIPEPDLNLQVGSGSHAEQTALIMQRFEPVLLERKPDWVLVYGDVNSTAGAALVCAKLLVPVAHVEAGLRSFDRRMPEEINRVVTDCLSDLLFTPSADADQNLQREGVHPGRIRLVGNVMIDTVARLLPRALERRDSLLARFNRRTYGLVTLHRPSNVDDPAALLPLLDQLAAIARELPLIFPIHPRTRQRLGTDFVRYHASLTFTEPLGYLDFLALQSAARLVITDSGGIQEETTHLGVPCLTFRENTERPITTTVGTNTVVGTDPRRLREEVEKILRGEVRKGAQPPLWDGQAAERIADVLMTPHQQGETTPD
jgi:UDP-N-acetylglucosamine 2-epimerase (non-hydrolysing)